MQTEMMSQQQQQKGMLNQQLKTQTQVQQQHLQNQMNTNTAVRISNRFMVISSFEASLKFTLIPA